jgi:predicted ATPase
MLTMAGAAFYATLGQADATLRYADELQTIATDYHLPAFQGWARFYAGWAHAMQGRVESGLTAMAAGREQLHVTGTKASLVHLSILLSQVHTEVGDLQRGREMIKQALQMAERTQACSYLAEIYRLQGAHCLAEAKTAAAETWLLKAIEVAQDQAAKFWELRATIDLARLWQAQGQDHEAYAHLASIYDWFTEGFAMPDLVEARALLADLCA